MIVILSDYERRRSEKESKDLCIYVLLPYCLSTTEAANHSTAVPLPCCLLRCCRRSDLCCAPRRCLLHNRSTSPPADKAQRSAIHSICGTHAARLQKSCRI